MRRKRATSKRKRIRAKTFQDTFAVFLAHITWDIFCSVIRNPRHRHLMSTNKTSITHTHTRMASIRPSGSTRCHQCANQGQASLALQSESRVIGICAFNVQLLNTLCPAAKFPPVYDKSFVLHRTGSEDEPQPPPAPGCPHRNEHYARIAARRFG